MKKYLYFLGLLAVILTWSCQRDEFIIEPDQGSPVLKSIKIADGKYTGNYSGGEWVISLPDSWNDQSPRYLVLYAHGMVDPYPYEPIQLPHDSVNGKPVEQLLNEMGLGYAATSYTENGLVVLDAIENIKDLVDVVNWFFTTYPTYSPPDYLYLGGPSEGGLVTVLTIEKYPKLFDGAMSICGPIGNFYRQLQYNGDFHVLFNYFFGADLATLGKSVGNPADGVPVSVMEDWKIGDLQDVIKSILEANPSKVTQLLNCANVTADMNDPEAMNTVVLECLRFNVMLTNDVKNRLQGVPFNNKYRWYSGSDNDWKLNREVQRVCTKDYYTARKNVKKYETSGEIAIPLVTLHTTGDHIVPFWHQPAYRLKIFLNGNSLLYTGIPVINYGHCTIDESDLIAGLAILMIKSGAIDLFGLDPSLFPDEKSLENFKKIMGDNAVDFYVK